MLRTPLKIMLGGALALLLAFSVAPANAVDPVVPEDGNTAVNEENAGAENASGDTGGESETADVPASDGSEDQADQSEPDVPADEPVPNEVPADQAPVVEAPETISVTGTVYVMPEEATPQTLEQLEAGEEHQVHEGTAVVATDQLGLVKLNDDGSEGHFESGSSFSGEVALPEQVREIVEDRIAAEGQLSVAELTETAANAAVAVGASMEATGVGIEADETVMSALSAQSHPVDVRYYGGNALPAPSRAQLESLINTSSAYWKGQTGGKIASMPVSSYKTLSPNASPCDPYAMWNRAIFDMGYTNANDYLTSGRHLVAFVNAGCGEAYGLALLGTFHSGGVTWIDLGMRGSGVPVSDAQHAVAHELGHTLGLGHSNARECTNPKVDAAVSSTSGRPVAGSGCSDSEYGDFWSVMGMALQGRSGKPAALTMPQKKMLGLTTSSVLKEVGTSGGAVQTFTINSASATSGLRGLRVSSPSPGKTFFVEYRNGVGQDSGMPWADGRWYRGGSVFDGYMSTGVRVLKAADTGNSREGKTSSVLSRWSGGTRYQELRAGNVLMPYGDTARVVVESASGSTAKVRVEYKGFKNGGKTVTTSLKEGGASVAGKTLQARASGAWQVTYGAAPSKVVDKYQWFRNGKAIPGATQPTYRTTAADIAQTVTVQVKPYASGWVSNKGVAASGKKIVSPPFVDVLYGQKFYSEINWMKSSGVSTGTRTSKGAVYAPKTGVSREAMAAFLYRLEAPKGFKAPAKSPFADVRPGQSFYREITWMYKSGLSTGTMRNGARFYDPKASVSREAMAAFLYRMEAPKGFKAPAKSPFADVRPGQKFYREIAWMYKSGISTGSVRSGQRFYDPKASVSREAMAAFLYRLKH